MQAGDSVTDGQGRVGALRRTLGVAGMVASVGLVACQPQATASAVPTAQDAQPTAQRSELCSAANVVGVGLKAEYFAQPGWRGVSVLSRTDGSVDFLGLGDLPEGLRTTLPRSVRWTGWVKAPTNGTYRFHVLPDNAKVMIARVDVQAASDTPQSVEMTAGRFYPITVEVDGLETAGLPVRLEWTVPHGARYVIPRALLNLPTETIAAPLR